MAKILADFIAQRGPRSRKTVDSKGRYTGQFYILLQANLVKERIVKQAKRYISGQKLSVTYLQLQLFGGSQWVPLHIIFILCVFQC